MGYTEAGKRATIKYIKNNYDRVEIKVPKGRKADIEAHAKARGDSVNGFISELIRIDMGLSDDEWKKQDGTPEE